MKNSKKSLLKYSFTILSFSLLVSAPILTISCKTPVDPPIVENGVIKKEGVEKLFSTSLNKKLTIDEAIGILQSIQIEGLYIKDVQHIDVNEFIFKPETFLIKTQLTPSYKWNQDDFNGEFIVTAKEIKNKTSIDENQLQISLEESINANMNDEEVINTLNKVKIDGVISINTIKTADKIFKASIKIDEKNYKISKYDFEVNQAITPKEVSFENIQYKIKNVVNNSNNLRTEEEIIIELKSLINNEKALSENSIVETITKSSADLEYRNFKIVLKLKQNFKWSENDKGESGQEIILDSNLTYYKIGDSKIQSINGPAPVDATEILHIGYNLQKEAYSLGESNAKIPSWLNKNIKRINKIFQGTKGFKQNLNSWDISNMTDMSFLFFDTEEFNGDISKWNVSHVTDMSNMFSNSKLLNIDISEWDVSNVKDMNSMFNGTSFLNEINISKWNTSNVTDMSGMFKYSKNFNQDISKWDVSNVTDMNNMFSTATSFNQNISDWKVGNVNNMLYMFNSAENFDQDISKWDVSKVTDMQYMFYNAKKFNSNISNWDVSNVTNMDNMFSSATAFNSDISTKQVSENGKDYIAWDVSNVTNMNQMFNTAKNFNRDISNWNVCKVKTNDQFDLWTSEAWKKEHKPKFNLCNI